MKNSYLFGAVCACILCIFSNVSSAAQITINISAEIEFVDDFGNILGGALNNGDMLSGSYTYESTTSDSNVLSTVGDYWHNSSPYGISLTGGGFTFETDPSDVQFLVEIVNDHGTVARDNYLLRSYNNLALSNGIFVEHISWQLDDPTAAALSSTELPLIPPSLSDWGSIFGVTINGCSALDHTGNCDLSSDQFFIRAHVISAELAAIPIPAAGWLFGSGLFGLIGVARRNKV